jgi:hypothetical protein
MIMPTIHINGTSRESLVSDLEIACNAIATAISAVIECAPNARDYYPQGDNAYATAVAEYSDRLHHLVCTRDELMTIWQHIVAIR